MWNDFDKFTIVRDKNGKKKTSKENIYYKIYPI
jgi:hypothetical protein